MMYLCGDTKIDKRLIMKEIADMDYYEKIKR